jgi:hypothetical protein
VNDRLEREFASRPTQTTDGADLQLPIQ